MRFNSWGRIILFLLFLFVAGCAPRVAIKKGYDFSRINRLGVLEFISYRDEVNSGNIVADEFVKELVFRGFDVVERERLESILREQHLSQSKILDPDTVKEAGKILGVDALVTGSVTRFIPERRDTVYFRDERGHLKTEVFLLSAEVGINARMVDVETGLVVWAGSYSYESFDMEGAVHGAVSGLLSSLKKVWPQMKK